jgi:antitoxin PrlF
MPTATLTTKGQVTIPKVVREHLGVDTGDRLSFVVQEDGTVIVKPITRHVRELGGLLERPGQPPLSINEMDEGVARRMRGKFGRRRR